MNSPPSDPTVSGTVAPVEASPGAAAWVRRATSWVVGLPYRISLPVWILLFFGVMYVEVTSTLSYIRYLGFLTNTWDLGIFQQALWTTGHGAGVLHYTAELPWNTSGSFLAVHFSPILFLLVPIYTVLPGPFTLMVIQSIVVTASAFPMYALAARRVGKWPGVGIAILYLSSPPILGGLLFDFHVEAFLPLFALGMWAAWEAKRYRLALVSAAFLLITIEYAPVILGGIAGGIFLHRLVAARKTPGGWKVRLGPTFRPFLVAVASIPLTLLMFSIPKWIDPTTPPATQIGPLGGSTSSIVYNVLHHPAVIGQALQIDWGHKVQYLNALWQGCLFAWPLAPFDALAGLPWIVAALVSADPNYSDPVGNQYAFLVVPFLFVGTAGGIRWAWDHIRPLRALAARALPAPSAPFLRGSRFRRTRIGALTMATPVVIIVLLAVAVPSQLADSPLSPSAHYSWLWSNQFPPPRDAQKWAILNMIPSNASVSAEPDLFPQVADRADAYPYYVPGTEFVVADVESWWFTVDLPPPMPPSLEWSGDLAHNVDVPYGLYATAEGVFLLKLGYTGPPVYYVPYATSLSGSQLSVQNRSTVLPLTEGPLGGPVVVPNGTTHWGTIWSSNNVMLPPGDFTVTLWFQSLGGPPADLAVVSYLGGSVADSRYVNDTGWGMQWIDIVETVHVPVPELLRIDGNAIGDDPSIAFGGLEVAETPATVVIG